MRLKPFLILAGLALAAVTHAQKPADTAGTALHALFDREWEWELTQDPLWASYLGDRRWLVTTAWPYINAATSQRGHAPRHRGSGAWKELAAIPRAQLSLPIASTIRSLPAPVSK